jgi:hypothetical protein
VAVPAAPRPRHTNPARSTSAMRSFRNVRTRPPTITRSVPFRAPTTTTAPHRLRAPRSRRVIRRSTAACWPAPPSRSVPSEWPASTCSASPHAAGPSPRKKLGADAASGPGFFRNRGAQRAVSSDLTQPETCSRR